MFEVQARSLRSARWWFSQRAQIDMEPVYQRRGGIWKVEDQQFLIDTIINDYDIPKLYLADFTTLKSKLNDERLRYAVIDGKQRLEAIFDFFSNRLSLSKRFEFAENRHVDIGGFFFKDLSEHASDIASKIEEYPLPIMHVVTDEPDRINELFVRLNKGASLTGAEKRNAMIGPVPKVISRIAQHPFFDINTAYSSNRGQDLNTAAKFLLFEVWGDTVDTKKKQLDELVDEHSDKNLDFFHVYIDEINDVLDTMSSAFGEKDPLLKTQGMIPVYYWLFRNMKPKNYRSSRARIFKFMEDLRRTRSWEDEDRPSLHSRFENAMRSTNDGWSHRLRFEILERVISR